MRRCSRARRRTHLLDIAAALALLLLLQGCGGGAPSSRRVIQDPISGSEMEVHLVEDPPWVFARPVERPASLLLVYRDGVLVSTVSQGGTGLEVTAGHTLGSLPVATVRDSDGDGRYEFIEYAGADFVAIDADLDGRVELRVDGERTLEILYDGSYVPVSVRGDQRFIEVDGEQREVLFEGWRWRVAPERE